MKRYIAIAAACLAAGCHSPHTEATEDMEYIPLSNYKYTPAQVDSGTNLRIIGFSGGKDSDKDNIYYCQFITINGATGDTVRVLASLIGYGATDGEPHESYTMSSMYDGRKGITDASFIPPDSTQDLMLNVPLDVDSGKNGSVTTNADNLYKLTRPKLVAINNSLPMLQTPSYKTVIGVLHFKEMPW